MIWHVFKKTHDLHARENGWAAFTMGWGYLLDVSLD